MLKKVEIQNFAIIESAIFEPGEHFTVISGETGAGKSLLIDALGSLAGKRSNKEFVRKGASFTRIEALFHFTNNNKISDFVREQLEDDTLILSREIYADGGSQARINGRMVSISLLKEISQDLIGLHAQNEQLSLFKSEEQRSLLDKYAADTLADLISQWQNLLKERKYMLEKIRSYGFSPEERDRRIDIIKYQIDEIEKADLRLDEDKELFERNKILSALSRIKKDIYGSLQILSQNEEYNVLELINSAMSYLDYSASHSKNVSSIKDRLENISFEFEQINQDLIQAFHQLEAEPNEIENINQRLDSINRLKMKYGDSIEDIFSFFDKAQEELENLLNSENLFNDYQEKLIQNEKDLEDLASKIHETRESHALKLASEISEALKQLAMPDVRFKVQVDLIAKNNKGYYGKYGRDKVEFLIQANPGQPLMPLRKIASGGEVSRILLAIKSIFGKQDNLSVLIFDEIDTGISGKTANQVGKMLKELSTSQQVLCVSHMAQITAAADKHYLIEKTVENNSTKTQLQPLDEEARLAEIARLLSGQKDDQSSQSLAKQLLTSYDN